MARSESVASQVSANVLNSAFWGQDAMMPKAIILGGENTLSSRSRDGGEEWGNVIRKASHGAQVSRSLNFAISRSQTLPPWLSFELSFQCSRSIHYLYAYVCVVVSFSSASSMSIGSKNPQTLHGGKPLQPKHRSPRWKEE